MTNEHLSDDRIQEILDELALRPGRPLPTHVFACPYCRERVDQYQLLYAGLAADPGFTLPPTFADSVLKKIPTLRPVFWRRPAVLVSLVAGGSALVLVGLAMTVNLKPVSVGAVRIVDSFAAAFRPLPAQFRQLLSGLNASFGLFLLGGLGLLAAAFFDQLLKRQFLHRSR